MKWLYGRFKKIIKKKIIKKAYKSLKDICVAMEARKISRRIDRLISNNAGPLSCVNLFNQMEDSQVKVRGSLRVLSNLKKSDEAFYVSLFPHHDHVRNSELSIFLRCEYYLYHAYYHLSDVEEKSLRDFCINNSNIPYKLRGRLALVFLMKGNIRNAKQNLILTGHEFGEIPSGSYRFLCRLVYLGEKFLFYSVMKELEEYGMSKPMKLKVNFLQKQLERRNGSAKDYFQLENQMLKIGDDVAKVYGTLKCKLDKIPQGKLILDTATNASNTVKFQKHIEEQLGKKVAFSYIRINDGECYGFPEEPLITISAIERQERHWWGKTLNIDVRKGIQKKFKTALAGANALGIPGVYKFIHDLSVKETDNAFSSSLLKRGFGTAFAVSDYLLTADYVLDATSNLDIFEISFLENLITKAKNVVIISGFRTEVVRDLFSNEKISFVELPTHNQLKDRNISSQVKGSLPDIYNEISSNIVSRCMPGTLCLFSAGFIGKILIHEATNKGAVCLDVGQQLLKLIEHKTTFNKNEISIPLAKSI